MDAAGPRGLTVLNKRKGPALSAPRRWVGALLQPWQGVACARVVNNPHEVGEDKARAWLGPVAVARPAPGGPARGPSCAIPPGGGATAGPSVGAATHIGVDASAPLARLAERRAEARFVDNVRPGVGRAGQNTVVAVALKGPKGRVGPRGRVGPKRRNDPVALAAPAKGKAGPAVGPRGAASKAMVGRGDGPVPVARVRKVAVRVIARDPRPWIADRLAVKGRRVAPNLTGDGAKVCR